ncbi:hypothetical protein CsSME_00032052 [Camellia sinensis var. sinensis]
MHAEFMLAVSLHWQMSRQLQHFLAVLWLLSEEILLAQVMRLSMCTLIMKRSLHLWR